MNNGPCGSSRPVLSAWKSRAQAALGAVSLLLAGSSGAAPELNVESPAGTAVTGKVVLWGSMTVPMATLRSVKSISAGSDWSMAVQDNDTGAAWGSNGSNQSGPPNAMTDMRLLVAGSAHGVGMRNNGQVVAWGYADYGQTQVPAGLSNVVGLTTTNNASLALRADGTVVHWGDTSWMGASDPGPPPAGLSGVKQISGGGRHVLALKNDGTVFAWGSNEYSDGGPFVVTGQASVPQGLSGVKAVSAGAYHSLALKNDGTVVAWGRNSYGQATVPDGLNDVIAISGGGYHSLALKRDGTVVAWGSNQVGQVTPPAGLDAVSAISAGSSHNMALRWTLDFNAVRTSGPAAVRTVTLRNSGDSPLNISGVTLSGANAADFTLNTAGMASTVAAGASTSLQVTFAPSALGTRTAVVRITNDDTDEGNYFLVLSGLGAVKLPEMSVSGNGVEIPAGFGGMLAENNTYFGTAESYGAPVTRSFTISNTGQDPLMLTGTPLVDVYAPFSVSVPPSSNVVPPGGTSTFELKWTPTAGFNSVKVTIRNDDNDEGLYTFFVTGIAVFKPIINTSSVTNVTATSASISGVVSSFQATSYGAIYSLTSVNPDPQPGGAGVTVVTGAASVQAFDGSFTTQVTGLAPGSNYSYRASAGNGGGTTYSAVGTFRTASLHPQDIEARGNGQVIPQGSTTPSPGNHTHFGTTTGSAPLTRTFTIANTGDDPLHLTVPNSIIFWGGQPSSFAVTAAPPAVVPPQGTVTFQITCTPPGDTLQSTQVTIYSDDADEPLYAFWVAGINIPSAPNLTTPAVTGITHNSASLGAQVVNDGGMPVTERGVVLAVASVNGGPIIGGAGATKYTAANASTGTFTVPVASLTPGTTYAFRAYAINVSGVSYTTALNFSTPAALPPTVTSPVVADITPFTATAGGNVTAANGVPITSRGVIYAPTAVNADPVHGGPGVTVLSASGTLGAFSLTLPDLTPSVAYTFKAWAANSVGTGYTTAVAFTTLPSPPPVIIRPAVSNVAGNTATLSARLLTSGGLAVSARGVVLSPVSVNASPFPGGDGVFQAADAGASADISVAVSGLTPGTTYAWKAFATNSTGTGYSVTGIFTTPGGPAPQITVTTLTDENDTPAGTAVSLREAIRAAAVGTPTTIGFDPSLDGGVLILTQTLAVNGRFITVDASLLPHGIVLDTLGSSRHFTVGTGAALSLTKLTLKGGRAAAGQSGGAVLSAGTLALTDCTFRDNEAGAGPSGVNGQYGFTPTPGGNGLPGGSGGAIMQTGPSLTAVRCRFIANKAGGGGYGGIGGPTNNPSASNGACGGNGAEGGHGGAISSTGALILTGCHFDGNKAGAGGGGGDRGLTYTYGPSPICTDNTTSAGGDSGSGGAIVHTGALTATGCSFTGNLSPAGAWGGNTSLYGGTWGTGGLAGNGGALRCGGGAVLLTNCTLAGNVVQDGFLKTIFTGTGGDGGAIYCTDAAGTSLRLIHCTVTGNHGDIVRAGIGPGAGPWSAGAGAGVFTKAAAQYDNCLIAANVMNRGSKDAPVWREENTGGSGVASFQPASPFPGYTAGGPAPVDPLTGTLTVSGGELPSVSLDNSSPALNTGVVIPGAPSVDQRGLPRAVSGPDLGAVEMQTGEPGALVPQSLAFSLPQGATLQLGPLPNVRTLSATTSAGLPAEYELLSGPASLTGNVLTIYGGGYVTVRASHPGDSLRAPAADVTATLQALPYTPPAGDSDGDGLGNIVEAALQLDPAIPNGPPLRLEKRPDGTLHAVLDRLPDVTGGWVIEIQTSTDLLQWATAAPVVTAGATPGFKTADVTLTGKSYARLRVTRLP